MKMEQEIPEFMLSYFEACDEEGKEEIRRLAEIYQHKRQLFFQTTYNEKRDFEREWYKTTGQRGDLNPNDAIKPLIQEYEQKARQILNKNQEALKKAGVDPDESTTIEAEQKKATPEETKEKFLETLKSISERPRQR